MSALDATERCSDRVADIGAGTGISSKLFLEAGMAARFGAGLRGTARFEHWRLLDFDGVRRRLLSSSCAPTAGHAQHAPRPQGLRELFDATAAEGVASFDYDTRIFAGTLP